MDIRETDKDMQLRLDMVTAIKAYLDWTDSHSATARHLLFASLDAGMVLGDLEKAITEYRDF